MIRFQYNKIPSLVFWKKMVFFAVSVLVFCSFLFTAINIGNWSFHRIRPKFFYSVNGLVPPIKVQNQPEKVIPRNSNITKVTRIGCLTCNDQNCFSYKTVKSKQVSIRQIQVLECKNALL